MNLFRQYANHLREFTVERQDRDLFEIFKSHEAAAVDLNIFQLREGKRPDGTFIDPPYTERTVEIKKAKGQRYDRVTLEDEGDLHGAIFIESSEFPARFESSDFKSPFLSEKYGNFYGLSETSKEDLRKGGLNADVKAYYGGTVFRLRNRTT